MAAHSLHVHWADQVKSCEKTLKASWKSLHNLQTSWRDHCHKKKSPLSHSVLNRCHINNFLPWDVQTSDKQLPTVQHEAPRRKTQCAFIQIYLPQNLLAKWMLQRIHLEKHCSRHTEFKLSHTQLWAPLWEYNWGCYQAAKTHQNVPFLRPQVRPQLTVHRVWQ